MRQSLEIETLFSNYLCKTWKQGGKAKKKYNGGFISMTFDSSDIANSMDPNQHVTSSLRAKKIVAWKSVGRGPM